MSKGRSTVISCKSHGKQSPFYLVDYVTLINTTTIFAEMRDAHSCNLYPGLNMLRLVIFVHTLPNLRNVQ